MFEHQVAKDAAKKGQKDAEDMLVLGLLAFTKWDRVQSELEKRAAKTPGQGAQIIFAEYFRVMDGFTPRELTDIRTTAKVMLIEHAAKHNQRSYWSALWQGVWSNWLYALTLLVAAWAIKNISPSDIVELINAAIRNRPQ